MDSDVLSNLSGMFLKKGVEWLKEHAVSDTHGVLRCRSTNARISVRMVRRYRARGGKNQPFLPEGDPALIGIQNQEMASLRILWCPACCSGHQDAPAQLSPEEFVLLSAH